MKRLFWLACCWPLAIIAQDSDHGIRWTQGLNWNQVRAKAKAENKYIFLDCYATWCGPCKVMDKDVYPVDSVGQYFNKRFISVKVQIDESSKDSVNQSLIVWRNDARNIRKQYRIDAFPTFLFFSPDGVLAHKSTGFQNPSVFLATARTATTPGNIYIDPHEHSVRLMEKYVRGDISIDSAFGLYEFFRLMREYEFAETISNRLYKFLTQQPIDSLFTFDRLTFIADNTTHTKSRWFRLFSDRFKEVNKAMKDDQYSQRFVGRVVANTIITPFLKMEASGRMLSRGKPNELRGEKEPDWRKLEKKIASEVNGYHTKKSLLSARMIWYQIHFNTPAFANTYLEFLERYGIGSHDWTQPDMINDFAYMEFFAKITDSTILKKITEWVKLVVEQRNDFKYTYHFLDTYASLLYVLGNSERALRWERMALEKAKERQRTFDVTFFQSVISKMERGEKLSPEN